MAPPVVQDSDDENALLDSPGVAPEPRSYPLLEVTVAADPSTGSTENLAGELFAAHENLLAPSPEVDVVASNDQGRTGSALLRSPTMSKIKRSRTTMDELRSAKKRKTHATYGNKTTLDDLGLSEAVIDGNWMHVEGEIPSGSDIESLESIQKKGALLRVASDDVESNDMNKMALNSIDPASEQAEKAPSIEGDHQEIPIQITGSGSVTLSQVVNGALEDLQNIDNSEPMAKRERAKKRKARAGLGNTEYQEPSLKSQTQSTLSEAVTEDELSSSRLSSVKGKSHQKFEQVQQLHEQNGGDVNEENPNTDLSSQACPSREKGRSKSNKSLPDSSQEDELAQEESVQEPLKESYVPRPSRSRGSALPEGYLTAIDFSKRPEAVAQSKSKIKRRKTTSDIVVHPDLNNGDNDDRSTDANHDPQKDVSAASGAQEPEEAAPKTEKKKKRGRPKKQQIEEPSVEPLADAVEYDDVDDVIQVAPPPAAPSGKKRGRKKKTQGNPSPETAVEEEHVLSDNVPIDGELQEQKPRSRKGKKKRSDSLICDEKEESEDDAYKEEDEKDITKTHNPTVLQESTTAANTFPSATTKHTNRIDSDSPSILSKMESEASPPAAETPKKGVDEKSKRLEKHSPISGTRMNYRVGLSRNARIEPLLRIVRK